MEITSRPIGLVSLIVMPKPGEPRHCALLLPLSPAVVNDSVGLTVILVNF